MNDTIPEQIRNNECIIPIMPTVKDRLWVISITKGPNTATDAHSDMIIKKITMKVNLFLIIRK